MVILKDLSLSRRWVKRTPSVFEPFEGFLLRGKEHIGLKFSNKSKTDVINQRIGGIGTKLLFEAINKINETMRLKKKINLINEFIGNKPL